MSTAICILLFIAQELSHPVLVIVDLTDVLTI